jgi:Raf kinase inhibitor-like YbhB/YbcL family protein
MLTSVMRSVGEALRPVRPGVAMLSSSKFSGFLSYALTVGSPAFADGQPMPVRFTQDGESLSPPLRWEGLPAQTQSTVLLVEDADIPLLRPLVHLIVHSIPPDKTEFAEGEIPLRMTGTASGGWACGRNALGRPGWTAPSPPPGHGPHRYAFQVFALDARPHFAYPPGRAMLLRTIRPHLIAQGRLIGTYERR